VTLRDISGTLPAEVRARGEEAARQFVAFFEVPLDGPLEIPVRYFDDERAFRDHLARNTRFDLQWIGYYDSRRREIVVSPGERSFGVLVHEICHFVVDTAFEEAPAWLDEGLAEFFETASFESGSLVVMDQPRHRSQLATWLEKPAPDLRELLDTNGWRWLDHEIADGQRVRALSWSVVDFLMSVPDGRRTLRAFMARLREQRGLHSLAALDVTFAGGAGAFERQWLEHVRARAKGM
jgi:hypothetical protein